MKLLLQGIDTLQCSYYLSSQGNDRIDFEWLMVLREQLRHAKNREPMVIKLGNLEFLLAGHGSALGFPFIIRNRDYQIEFGEYQTPNFLVTFRSEALWRDGAPLLHRRFLEWAHDLGYQPFKEETVSRVDFCFDYHLERMDFDEDDFLSLASKDSQHRENGRIQTFTFGKSNIVLRVYDKVAEIRQQSSKVWFYEMWGVDRDVWRIEWQLRKAILRRFDIETVADLSDQQGDLLRYLAFEHTTLRQPTKDSNRSRWPLHPLWVELQTNILSLNSLGIYRVVPDEAVLRERRLRIAVSIYGYLKRLAAIHGVQQGKDFVSVQDAEQQLNEMMLIVHDPLNWKLDVEKRIKHMELGSW